MKKSIRLLIILTFFLGTSLLNAQPNIGVYAGVNSSKLNGDSPEKASYESLPGLNAGANLDFKVGKTVWISVQPSYSREGTKISYTIRDKYEPVDSVRIRLNYVSVPVILKVSFINDRFYAIGGFETAYLLNNTVSSHDEEQDVDLNVSQWNLAIQFGIGLHIPVGFPRLYVELRYSQGVLNLTDEPLTKSYVPRVKTAGFTLLTGIEIPLKKMK
jgi:hypothetical protein